MLSTETRRKERRLCYVWPLWFVVDAGKAFSHAQMADVSSSALAFTCRENKNPLNPGQNITARFSVPRFGSDGDCDTANFTRTGSVYRIDTLDDSISRIVLQFAENLPFKPGEQVTAPSQTSQKQKAV